MSFAFDKPMIVRMMEPITAIVGVYFVYVFLINYDTELLASLGFLLLEQGTLSGRHPQQPQNEEEPKSECLDGCGR